MNVKKVIGFVLTAILLLSFFIQFELFRAPDCVDPEFGAAYTQAVCSIPDAVPEKTYPIGFYELERDEYGRALVGFYCWSWFGHKGAYLPALLVAQPSDEGFAAYYEDVNYIAAPPVETEPEGEEEVRALFSEEQLRSLKLANDWGQPVRPEKTVKWPVLEKKEQVSYRGNKERLCARLGSPYLYCDDILVDTDRNGQQLYCVILGADNGLFRDPTPLDSECYLVIVGADGSIPDTGIEKLTDRRNCQAEMARLKTRNGWSR